MAFSITNQLLYQLSYAGAGIAKFSLEWRREQVADSWKKLSGSDQKMSTKIINIEELEQRSKRFRSEGKKLVATNGCFELLHVGHVRYLQAARAMGDALAVGVNDDRSVRELKGHDRPANKAQDRAEVLAALACVDFVTIFPETRATRFIEAAQPAIYAKGGDYTSETLDAEERAALEKIKAEIQIVPFERGYSTSGLIERLRGTKE